MFHVKHPNLLSLLLRRRKISDHSCSKTSLQAQQKKTQNIPKKFSFFLLKCLLFVLYYHYMLN